MLSNPIGSNEEGVARPEAQQKSPGGAGTARAAGTAGSEIRWVGEQRLMEGYCGRAVVTGRAEVAAAANGPSESAASDGQGAPAYAVRPVALLQRPRHSVVRIGPKARPAGADENGGGPQGSLPGGTQARAA